MITVYVHVYHVLCINPITKRHSINYDTPQHRKRTSVVAATVSCPFIARRLTPARLVRARITASAWICRRAKAAESTRVCVRTVSVKNN